MTTYLMSVFSVFVGMFVDTLNPTSIVEESEPYEISAGVYNLDERTLITKENGEEYITVVLEKDGEPFEYYESISERRMLWNVQRFQVTPEILREAGVPACEALTGVTILGYRDGEIIYRKFCAFDKGGEQVFPVPPAKPSPKAKKKKEKRFGKSDYRLLTMNLQISASAGIFYNYFTNTAAGKSSFQLPDRR